MEIVAPLTAIAATHAAAPLYSLAAGPQLVLWLFVLHYVNRAVIQPLRNPPRSHIHLSVALSAMVFNSINGYLLGTWLTKRGEAFQGPTFQVIIGLVLFVVGAVGNIWHDEILRALRIGAPFRTYRIPCGGMYHFISYPNYFCECTFTLTRDRVVWLGAGGIGTGASRANRLPPRSRVTAACVIRGPRDSYHATPRMARAPVVHCSIRRRVPPASSHYPICTLDVEKYYCPSFVHHGASPLTSRSCGMRATSSLSIVRGG